MGLFEELRNIAQDIENQRHLMTNEEATLQVSIRPFIEALGYDFRNLSEVAPQFTADPRPSGTDRVDYAILREGKPIILIEAKAATVRFTENIWKKLHDYFNAEEVRFGILTNGIVYRFYSDLQKSNIMDKEPFLVIDMLNLNESLVNELRGFTKSSFDPELILSNVQKLAISQLLSKEFNQPSDNLVKHFAGQVHSGPLPYSQMPQYRQLVQQAWRDLIEQEIARRIQIPVSDVSEPEDTHVEDTRTKTTFDASVPNPEPIDPKPREPRIIQDHANPARRLFEWGTKTAKGFIKNRRGSLRIYDPAGEKHFWVEDERILAGTCYQDMDIEISTSHRVEIDNPPPATKLVNVIPDDDRFDFKYEYRGRGRYVVTGILQRH
ncbi:MAG: type I restriction enzyme HsdR N-terminal domain-containing protein [Chloroflexi bacterium]|nr:type I restriction enzyme HsdR N-terminal domain-containing protein [Chloroflexota bacterium]